MRVVWADGARTDLLSLVSHIAAENARAAKQMAERIRKRVWGLRRLARAGRIIPEFDDPALREVIVPPFRVLYFVDEIVSILAVHHGRRALSLRKFVE